MNKKITVPLPLNIRTEELCLFNPYVSYEIYQLKVQKLKNVFVTNSGFCLNKEGLIKECHHDYPHQYGTYISDVGSYYYNVVIEPDTLIRLEDDKLYLTIHHAWFNYYHWICESIFRLWMVRNDLDHLVLILPEYYKNYDFIMGSLEPFKIKNIYFIPEGKSLIIRNLCLPQIKPICDSYIAHDLKHVSEFYRNYVLSEKEIFVEKHERLYVSRQLARRRQIVNEDEVFIVLKKFGFKIFFPEQHSFLEQVAFFSNVKFLVGAHGSGLTNLLFVKKGASLLELHKNKTNELDHPSPLFWYMAEALEINYYHQSCETFGREDYFEGDYIVDIEILTRNLELMLTDAP